MSPADDEPGLERTYYPFTSRRGTQVFASSMMVILVVETALTGLFMGSLTFALTDSVGWALGVGVIAAAVVFTLWMWLGYRGYREVWSTHVPLRTTPGAIGEPRD